MLSHAAKTMLERSTVSESVEAAATVSPTESEIAIVAYLLWLDDGCPVGSDQEYWFRAEATLTNALVARCHKPPESVMLAEFRWEGHWEVWESEWGGARWVWDLGHSRRRSFESSSLTDTVR